MGRLLNKLKADTPATPATVATQATETEQAPPATVATVATQERARGEESQESQESQRARLLRIAKAEGLPASLVHKLTTDELAEITGEPDKVLSAYLRALECTAVREAGQVPDEYDKKAYCRGCGWVWLFTTGTVDGCPWCWNRAKGLPIPRPAVRCIDCQHFKRTEHPHIGHCAQGQPEAPAGLWDTDTRVCAAFKPNE